jgi:glycosyltransferase involved in cell wall biosynthesis
LTRQKDAPSFVQAARRVLEAGRDSQFLLVGEGKEERALRRMVREYGLEGRVVLAGYRPDIPQVLAALDVFVLPSLYEGLPTTLMEAMAAGRPVVATDVDGNRDLIRDGETGLLVPPRDAEALADALVHLLSAPDERERLGRMALEAARSRPTPEQMTGRVIELYLSLLEGRPAATDRQGCHKWDCCELTAGLPASTSTCDE